MKQPLFATIFFIVLTINISICIDPPTWPNTFSQGLIVTDLTLNIHATGKVYYDASNNRQRYDIHNSQLNPYCNSVSNGSLTFCTTILTSGNLYVSFPNKQMCCRCCSQKYCPITPRDAWKDFEYLGEANLQGGTFYKWGYQDRSFYYASEDETFTPRRIQDPGVQIIDFLTSSYSEDKLSDSIFALPSYCRGDCPKQSICGRYPDNSKSDNQIMSDSLRMQEQ